MHLRAENPSPVEGFSVTLEFMRKSQLIVTCLIDTNEPLADRLQAALHDGCPVELIINGRHLNVAMTASIQDSRENS